MSKINSQNPTGIQIFTSETFGEIRTCQIDNQIMFVGSDVAKALGYAKPQNALAIHVESEDKTTALIQGTGSNYKTKVVIINESGLYSLILSSKLEQAKEFKRWVTSEVLPQIRQTGGKSHQGCQWRGALGGGNRGAWTRNHWPHPATAQQQE